MVVICHIYSRLFVYSISEIWRVKSFHLLMLQHMKMWVQQAQMHTDRSQDTEGLHCLNSNVYNHHDFFLILYITSTVL